MAVCVPAACAALLTGCGSTVAGYPVAAEWAGVTTHVGTGLAELLPDPATFPAGYVAVVLPPEAAAQVASDLSGIGPDARVQPGGCLPSEQDFGPDQTAIAVGTHDATRATLTVELIRVDQPLSVLRDQLTECASVRVTGSGATITVTTELQPLPIGADDTLAFRRVVAPDVSMPGLTRSMQTRTGQIGDVRISVTYMTFTDARPDTAALDALFTETVQRVRTG